ncbi:MAG: HprK-related kinase B [Pseudomonadales bacterium]|jgi:HprK-related kinase B|nr:HprK-related kinase B [Pseudomonadales bacterium]MDP4639782.1 HprK-related kinase B [Pseudomonadales bacterium]MDP4765084.1 HprK-related kinase B [Pseudomonadales bacterium]MDP4874864.1 HprK-related kinase B [Pseudomonadales bacterium]MDP5058428.1 HprK-related kinase B [Pseudomonadales bacterium]
MTDLISLLEQSEQKCTQALLLDLGGFLVCFKSNSSRLIDDLRDYYQYFLMDSDRVTREPDSIVIGYQCATPAIAGDWQVKQPDPGKTKVKESLLHLRPGELVIHKVLTGIHLLFAGKRRVCFGPLEANPNQVVNFINNMHLDALLSPAGQLFHASGVCVGEHGLGMAGKSGKGKSTLALRLLQRGMDLVSNDRLVVINNEQHLGMHGITKYPRINPGTVINQPELLDIVKAEDMARYEAMDFHDLWELEEKYDAFVEAAFGVDFVLNAKMRMFVALDWDRTLSAPTRLDRRDPKDYPKLVETVMKSPGIMLPASSTRIPAAVVEPYIALLSECEFYVLSGGVDFDAAADLIQARLARF